MNYDFKKLSAVEQVSEMSDNANVLIEDNGKIKRAPNVTVSWDALKNKPFYENIERTTILDECSISMAYLDGWDEFRTPLDFTISINEPIVTGQKYKVLFDGVEYEGTAYEGEGYHALGVDYYGRQEIKDGMNFGLVFGYLDSTLTIVFALSDIGPDHTIAIYKETSTVHKIDKKFIPNAICGTDVEYITLHITDYVCDSVTPEDYERLYNAVLNNTPIFGWVFNDNAGWKSVDLIYGAYLNAPDEDRNYSEAVVIYCGYTDYIVYPDGTVEDY